MADIGQYLEKVDGKYYIYKKAKVAFEKMMVDFNVQNPGIKLTIVSGYYSKFQVLEDLRKVLKIKGKDTTDTKTKELLASKETVQSLADESEENYTKILTYIKTTTAEEYEPTLLPTLDSASTPPIKIVQIPTLEIKKFKDVDDINDIRKSGRIVTPAAEDMKVLSTQNWLLNNSYKYGFLLYLNVALYYIGLDRITNLLKEVKPTEGTTKLTEAQIAQQNLLLRSIIGKYQTSMDAVNAITTIDATAFVASIPPEPVPYAGGKSPYANGKKKLPLENADSIFNDVATYKNKYKKIDTGMGEKVLNLDEVELKVVNKESVYVPKAGVNPTVTAIMGTRFATTEEEKTSGQLTYTTLQNRKAAAIKTITLHFTAGNPGGTAESAFGTVHKPWKEVSMPGSKHNGRKALRDVRYGLHYASDNFGHLAKGGDDLTVLWTSSDWNGQALGIEMAGIGSVTPVLNGMSKDAFDAMYPPGIVHKAYPSGSTSRIVIADAYKSYPYPYNDNSFGQNGVYPAGRDFEWANLGYKYNGHQYYNEFTEVHMESLQLLIEAFMKKYNIVLPANAGWWTVFGMNEKPGPTVQQSGATNSKNALGEFWALSKSQSKAMGIFGHSTGNPYAGGKTAFGEMHSDTCPTPRLIDMLVRLGYKRE